MADERVEHVDVLIIGAGLSGIGAAWHVRQAFPTRSYLLLEAREALGGTWDLFRYPGIRSDSDMHTLGFRFRPWRSAKAIADGPAILDYLNDTAREAGIVDHIRYRHKVTAASWSSESAQWTVTATGPAGEVRFTCDFLLCCSGYYNYDQGYTPTFAGADEFTAAGGEIVHPQHWPAELDHAGKRIVVIGSGATAVTLVPALADTAEHVTMLQRSPSYIVSLPGSDPIANGLRKVVGPRLAYPVIRWKNVLLQMLQYRVSKRWPAVMRRLLRKMVVRSLPAGFDVDTHFNPSYNPWDQRLCVVPDGDLFHALNKGTASVVTGRIDRFDATGVLLESGEHVDADLIVTATGLDLLALGGAALTVDGTPVDLHETIAYKGMMLSGIPNFAFTVGYTNASWTLKADLVSGFVVRMLRHLDRTGTRIVVPTNDDPSLERKPLMDFASGYVQRSLHRFPQAGSRKPWLLAQNYAQDVVTLRHRPLEDGVLRFSDPAPAKPRVGARD